MISIFLIIKKKKKAKIIQKVSSKKRHVSVHNLVAFENENFAVNVHVGIILFSFFFRLACF